MSLTFTRVVDQIKEILLLDQIRIHHFDVIQSQAFFYMFGFHGNSPFCLAQSGSMYNVHVCCSAIQFYCRILNFSIFQKRNINPMKANACTFTVHTVHYMYVCKFITNAGSSVMCVYNLHLLSCKYDIAAVLLYRSDLIQVQCTCTFISRNYY